MDNILPPDEFFAILARASNPYNGLSASIIKLTLHFGVPVRENFGLTVCKVLHIICLHFLCSVFPEGAGTCDRFEYTRYLI